MESPLPLQDLLQTVQRQTEEVKHATVLFVK